MTTFTQTIGGTPVQFDLTIEGRKVSGTVTPEGGSAIELNSHGGAHFPVAASADDVSNSDASITVKSNGVEVLVNVGRVGYNDAFRYNLASGEVTFFRQAQAA